MSAPATGGRPGALRQPRDLKIFALASGSYGSESWIARHRGPFPRRMLLVLGAGPRLILEGNPRI
jgi:hypothetical protein